MDWLYILRVRRLHQPHYTLNSTIDLIYLLDIAVKSWASILYLYLSTALNEDYLLACAT